MSLVAAIRRSALRREVNAMSKQRSTAEATEVKSEMSESGTRMARILASPERIA
jgi:hypothetical protein